MKLVMLGDLVNVCCAVATIARICVTLRLVSVSIVYTEQLAIIVNVVRQTFKDLIVQHAKKDSTDLKTGTLMGAKVCM